MSCEDLVGIQKSKDSEGEHSRQMEIENRV